MDAAELLISALEREGIEYVFTYLIDLRSGLAFRRRISGRIRKGSAKTCNVVLCSAYHGANKVHRLSS